MRARGGRAPGGASRGGARASATRPLVKRTGPFRHVRVQAVHKPRRAAPHIRLICPGPAPVVDDAGRLLGLRLLLRVVAHARRLRGLPAAPAAERDLGHAALGFGRRRRVPQARSRAARRANAPAAAPARRWWLAATASDDGAVQISKDPEKTRRALEASRLTSLDDRLQAAVSAEGAVPGATVLAAPLSRRLAWTMMDEKYAHDMLFDIEHMARHVAGFEKLVVVALDQKTTRACAAGSISAAFAGAAKRAASRRPAR